MLTMPAESDFKVYYLLNEHVCKLLSDVYGLGVERTGSDLREKLDRMADEMDAMVQQHIKSTVQSMTKNAESQCPHIFESINSDIEERTREKSQLPKEFVKDLVVKRTGTEVLNKVSELNLSVATLISEKVTDTLLAALSQCNTTLTEQLKKKKQEQAEAREQLYRKAEEEATKENDASNCEKIEVVPPDESTTEDEEPVVKEEPKPDKKPSATDSILPAMRQERAASIARRKQRPISNPALDLEYKRQSEELPTPPRPSSPITEAPTELPAPPDLEPDEVKLEISEEKNEVTKEKESPTIKKKQKVEETEKENKEDEKIEEMVNDDVEQEQKAPDDADGKIEEKEEKEDIALPELPTSSRKLEHVTKGRPRPTRRAHRKPVVRETETDGGVDNFFSASVQSTNFDKVPTLEEEKKEAQKEAQEKTPKKPMGIGLPGMGSITPEMLRRRKKVSDSEDKASDEDKKPESPKEKEEEKNGEQEEEEDGKPKTPEPVVKKRPPGAMGLPGMGFGGNVLAEMKLKKLNKSKSPEPSHDDSKGKDSKTDGEQAPVPFGRSMLKKTNHAASATFEKPDANSNNNNNKEWTKLRSTPNRAKSRSFQNDEKPEVTVKSKTPLLPPKPTPPPSSSKPGKGPPLPSKLKPAVLRPDSELRGGRTRPMSEFIDPKHVPSSVKLRAASWGKKPENSDGKE